ncbi:hypothetical protein GF380_01405 [Candidatus Uhrbacteria bacterium]|nr:hypothetical protein [Candidatus Uhrbacteria bacterium]MBD3283936.1 hypothetical protein [Candidatus Uhrbacteria bacterium]
MLKKMLTKGISVLTTFAVSLTFLPSALFAQDDAMMYDETSMMMSEEYAEDDVILEEGDTPLERYAKLRRTWVVYREVDSAQIYAITHDKTKRAIQTLDFFTQYNANYRIQLVKVGRLAEIQDGEPLTTMDGFNPEDYRKRPWRCRLVKASTDPAVYLVCGNKKRVIVREGVFHRYGWEFRDVETVDQTELDAYDTGAELNEETVFTQDVEVETTENRKLRERIMERLRLRGKTLIRNRLIKSVDDPKVYFITRNGELRHIEDETVVYRFGLDLGDVTEVSADELEAFEESNSFGADDSAAVLDQRVE